MKARARLLMLIFLCVRCNASVDKIERFHVDGLSATESVNVDIHSDIPGRITWIYTDDIHFNINVKIQADDDMDLKATVLNLTTSNSSVTLVISNRIYPIAPAQVTGTGNTLNFPTYLMWFLALLIGWDNPMAVFMAVLLYGCSPGWADKTYTVPSKMVEIEVRAPRRLTYKAIDLYINGGKLRLIEPPADDSVFPTCKTSNISEGCPFCCHGNGACSNNQCVCDDNYDQESNCAFRLRESILFSHPFDPRLERVILPNNNSLTLSRAYQYIQEPPYLKDPDVYAMHIRAHESTFPRVLILFQTNGLVSEIVDMATADEYKVKLRKSRIDDCLMRLKSTSINLEINICQKNNFTDKSSTDSDNSQEKDMVLENRMENETKTKKRKRQRVKSQSDYKFVNFPVRIERCGYKSSTNKYVYVQLYRDKYDSDDRESPRNRRYLSLNRNENIVLLSHDNYDGTISLRFPDIMVPLGVKEIASKCGKTIFLRRKICFPSNLDTFSVICDNIFNHTQTKKSSPPLFQRTEDLCSFVLKTIKSYCDESESKVLSENTPCASQHQHTFDLFSRDLYRIKPYALFPDDKLVPGEELIINLNDKHEIGNHELAIIDKEAEFKIVKISVIPNDPVPHDIYQVKLDYMCATRDTIIKMTVYGSDFYSNDVICHGVTSCNCCILHAAGAPNAVVDHVTINVTDTSRNYSHIREMVVVF